MEIPYTISTRPDTGLWNAKIGIWLFLASEVMLFGGLFSAYVFLRLDAQPGEWPHGLLNVPVGTMNTAILIMSSVTVVLAWAALKMRRYRSYWWYMLATIMCGIIFLFVKLYYEWPQKFEHYGIFIKPGALEKYEQYLGNNRRTEKGMEPRIEISGHLHNPEALKDPNIKEYEIGLDPVFVDPNNPSNDRPHFFYAPPTDHIAKIHSGRGTVRISRVILPLPACMERTCSPASWFSFTCGCRSAKNFTNAIRNIWPIESRSADSSGTLSILSGFLSSRSFICFKP